MVRVNNLTFLELMQLAWPTPPQCDQMSIQEDRFGPSTRCQLKAGHTCDHLDAEGVRWPSSPPPEAG